MDLFQDDQFVHSQRDTDDKIQRRVSPVDEFVRPLFDDVTHFGGTWQNIGRDVPQDPAFVTLGVGREEFAQPNFTLTAHQDDEIPPDLCKCRIVSTLLCLWVHG